MHGVLSHSACAHTASHCGGIALFIVFRLHTGPNKGDLLAFGSGDMSQLGLGDDENMRER